MSDKVLDKHVRVNLHEYLAIKHGVGPDVAVIDELVLQRKDGRADVAVVDQWLHCYEIKSDADTLNRLKRQVRVYGKVFDYLSVVVTDKHLTLAKAALPEYWGLHVWFPKSEVFEKPAQVLLVRPPVLNTITHKPSLAQLLWKPSAVGLLAAHNAAKGFRDKPRWAIWARVVEVCSYEQIHAAVCAQLKTHRRLERTS